MTPQQQKAATKLIAAVGEFVVFMEDKPVANDPSKLATGTLGQTPIFRLMKRRYKKLARLLPLNIEVI